MLRWFAWVRRTQALSYPLQFWTLFSKGTCRQQVKSPVGAGSSTKHWSSLALPSCSSHLLLRCFPPGILKHYLLLAAFSNKWCSQKKTWGLQCSALLQLSPGKAFQDAFCLLKVALAEETGNWDTWWSHSVLTSFLWLKTGCSVCNSLLRWHTTNVPRIPPHEGDWGTLGVNQQALAQDAVHQILSLYFTEVSGRRFRSKALTQNSCRMFVSNTSTAIMRGILQYLTHNNPCSLNEICL